LNARADIARAMDQFQSFSVPADGTRLPLKETGDFGTSPIFGQLSDKPSPVRM